MQKEKMMDTPDDALRTNFEVECSNHYCFCGKPKGSHTCTSPKSCDDWDEAHPTCIQCARICDNCGHLESDHKRCTHQGIVDFPCMFGPCPCRNYSGD